MDVLSPSGDVDPCSVGTDDETVDDTVRRIHDGDQVFQLGPLCFVNQSVFHLRVVYPDVILLDILEVSDGWITVRIRGLQDSIFHVCACGLEFDEDFHHPFRSGTRIQGIGDEVVAPVGESPARTCRFVQGVDECVIVHAALGACVCVVYGWGSGSAACVPVVVLVHIEGACRDLIRCDVAVFGYHTA